MFKTQLTQDSVLTKEDVDAIPFMQGTVLYYYNGLGADLKDPLRWFAREVEKQVIAAMTFPGEIDYTLQKGDRVYNKHWGQGKKALEVLDVNFHRSVRAAALRLLPGDGTVVWPLAGLSRTPFDEDVSGE